jgi:hypothetical protein
MALSNHVVAVLTLERPAGASRNPANTALHCRSSAQRGSNRVPIAAEVRMMPPQLDFAHKVSLHVGSRGLDVFRR